MIRQLSTSKMCASNWYDQYDQTIRAPVKCALVIGAPVNFGFVNNGL